MWHPRVLMQESAYPVTNEVLVYCKPGFIGCFFDCCGDIRNVFAGPTYLDCIVEGLLGDINLNSKAVRYHSLDFWINFSKTHHDRVIPEVSIFVAGHIEIHPVSIFEHSCVWHAMTQNIIGADANRLREAHEPDTGWVGTFGNDEVVNQLIRFFSRHSELDSL